MKQSKTLGRAMFGILLLTAFNASAMMRRLGTTAASKTPISTSIRKFSTTPIEHMYVFASAQKTDPKMSIKMNDFLSQGNGKRISIVRDNPQDFFIGPDNSIWAPTIHVSLDPHQKEAVLYRPGNLVKITPEKSTPKKTQGKDAFDLTLEDIIALDTNYKILENLNNLEQFTIDPTQVVSHQEKELLAFKKISQIKQDAQEELARIKSRQKELEKDLSLNPFAGLPPLINPAFQ